MAILKKWFCGFTDELKSEFVFVKKELQTAFTDICNSDFLIGCKIQTSKDIFWLDKHNWTLLAAALSPKLSDYFCKAEFELKEKELTITDAGFSYHTIIHKVMSHPGLCRTIPFFLDMSRIPT